MKLFKSFLTKNSIFKPSFYSFKHFSTQKIGKPGTEITKAKDYVPVDNKTKEELVEQENKMYEEMDYYYGSKKIYNQEKDLAAYEHDAKKKRLFYLNMFYYHDEYKTINVKRYRRTTDTAVYLMDNHEIPAKIHARDDDEEINFVLRIQDIHYYIK